MVPQLDVVKNQNWVDEVNADKKLNKDIWLKQLEHFLKAAFESKIYLICSSLKKAKNLTNNLDAVGISRHFRINQKLRFPAVVGLKSLGAFYLGYTWIWSTVYTTYLWTEKTTLIMLQNSFSNRFLARNFKMRYFASL